MANTNKDREMFSYSNARLRRARRLYCYLIFDDVIGNIPMMVKATLRARDAGLYSQKTSKPDTCMFILSAIHKLDIEANPRRRETRISETWLQDNFNIICFYWCRSWFKRVN